MNIQCHACIGGTNVGEDIRKLEYGQHIVSGSPGRVADMIRIALVPIALVSIAGRIRTGATGASAKDTSAIGTSATRRHQCNRHQCEWHKRPAPGQRRHCRACECVQSNRSHRI
jgi:hypothetical protein